MAPAPLCFADAAQILLTAIYEVPRGFEGSTLLKRK